MTLPHDGSRSPCFCAGRAGCSPVRPAISHHLASSSLQIDDGCVRYFEGATSAPAETGRGSGRPSTDFCERLADPLRWAGCEPDECHRPQAEIRSRFREIADKLHISHVLHKRPAHLSGGERQRVAIGRALMRDAQGYLMDDPISALDARLREEMRVELKRLQRDIGHTLIYVTHDQEEAMAIADRMAILDAGAVRQLAQPQAIYETPNCRYVAARRDAVHELRHGSCSRRKLLRRQVGVEASCAARRNAGRGTGEGRLPARARQRR